MSATPAPPEGLTNDEKVKWNKFLDFVKANNMQNNPILDQRNKQVGMSLLQKFNYADPKNALPTDIVPRAQQELQNYRNTLINQYRAGKIQPSEPIKSEDEIMPNISPVDSWPGTKTLSHYFPVATEKIVTPTGSATKNYGVDVATFDKNRGLTGQK